MEAEKVNANMDSPAPENAVVPEKFGSTSDTWEFVSKNMNLFGISESTPYPPEVKRRLKALKNIQVDMFKIECDFYEELHNLELKYSHLHKNLYEKRADIIAGKYEPTDEETRSLDESAVAEDKPPAAANGNSPPVNGIPKFWLTILKNVYHLDDMLEPHDIPILEHLEDIKLELTKEPMGFKLYFYFSPNDYFTNDCLVKFYQMRVIVDPKDPLSFEGTEIYKSTGCTINWKAGKDATKREVKKKQKHKRTGVIRLISKIEQRTSFFEFFNPPQVADPENEEPMDPMVQDKIQLDFEIGSSLKERIIPRAVLYFTGEANDSDDDGDDDDEEEEDIDESGEDGEQEEIDYENASGEEDDK